MEHETIDKEQFERLLHGEPEHDVLPDDPPPYLAPIPKPKRKRTSKPRTRRAAPKAEPLPDTAVAHAVKRTDLG